MDRLGLSIVVSPAVVSRLAGCEAASRPVNPEPIWGIVGSTMSRVGDDPAPLVLHLIAPRTTDPEITWTPAVSPQFANHYVWLDTIARSNPKLLGFMPGANNVPGSWQL